jgi:hypothetical protein
MISGSYRTLANHGTPNQSINVLDRLDLRADNSHPSKDIVAANRILNRINRL